MPWGDRTHGRNAPRSIDRSRRFVSELARRWQRTTRTTRTTMATACATTRLTRERSTAMVANMLRVALYTVTYCRGATTGG